VCIDLKRAIETPTVATEEPAASCWKSRAARTNLLSFASRLRGYEVVDAGASLAGPGRANLHRHVALFARQQINGPGSHGFARCRWRVHDATWCSRMV
jgi:hypothetical protein